MSIIKLWLECEEVCPNGWDINKDFCNVAVKLKDGREYGLNVWTFNYFSAVLKETNEEYIVPPDLFVKELTRNCIEKTLEKLIQIDDLEKILNPSVLTNK